jgi:hypothetical protein
MPKLANAALVSACRVRYISAPILRFCVSCAVAEDIHVDIHPGSTIEGQTSTTTKDLVVRVRRQNQDVLSDRQ